VVILQFNERDILQNGEGWGISLNFEFMN